MSEKSNWHPISTAPSGRRILIADRIFMAVVQVENLGPGMIEVRPPINFVPTHWAYAPLLPGGGE